MEEENEQEEEEEIKKKEVEENMKTIREINKRTKPKIKVTKGKTKKYVRISGIDGSLFEWTTIDEFNPRGLAKAFHVAKEEFGEKLRMTLEDLARKHGWSEEEIDEFRRLTWSDEDLYGEGLEDFYSNVVKRFQREKKRRQKMWNKILSPKKKRGRPKKVINDEKRKKEER